MRKITFKGEIYKKSFRILAVLCLGLCCMSVLAIGQSATGLIGNVTDPSGAIVPGVTITLTNKATAATRT